MIYTIGDLHLSLGCDKPMDIFSGWSTYGDTLNRIGVIEQESYRIKAVAFNKSVHLVHGLPPKIVVTLYKNLFCASVRGALNGERAGITYKLVSADGVGFDPIQVN